MGKTLESGRTWCTPWLLLLVVQGSLPAEGALGQATEVDSPVSRGLAAEARQFDFWVGTWDVNLRVRQEDGSWADQHRAVAHVYPILMGKAILELWSEDRVDGIKGFSVRSYDPRRGEWDLWLNWPGPNRSGTSTLSGGFRHARGEFFVESPTPDGGSLLARYSFSDIGPDRLRWDDAYSRDGGATWSHNWIMEFSRLGGRPEWAAEGAALPTVHDGERCDAPQYRAYDFLAGSHVGEVEAGGQGAVTITGHRILDGCAVITFAGASGDPASAWGFSHLTWSTALEQYELLTLTFQPATPVRRFVTTDPEELVFYEEPTAGAPARTSADVDRFRIEALEGGGFLWVHETPSGDGWRPVWKGRLGGS